MNTLYLNFRTGGVGGSVAASPWLLEGDGLAEPLALTSRWRLRPGECDGRRVVIATHGFNVSYASGVRGLAALKRDLALGDNVLFIGVLWPGDWWLPVVNYPAEAADAVRCGRGVAAFANEQLKEAASISFLSHSLGARVVLQAVAGMSRRAREVVVTAAAADDNCLGDTYAAVAERSDRVCVLASRKDKVLRVAYRVGDWASDIFFRDTDDAWRCALGFHGPRPDTPAHVVSRQIPEADGYDHGDYFPRGGPPVVSKATKAVAHMRACLSGAVPDWPDG